MLVFPQLSTGASTQYPIGKMLSQRNVESSMEDGTIISLADTFANYLKWKIKLQDISDQEAQALTDFFESTQGSLQSFLFLDPTSNLLLWSQDFTQSAWSKTGVTFDQGLADSMGGANAVCARNQTGASLSVAQQSPIPGSTQTCFSIYMRSDAPATVPLNMSVGNQSQSAACVVTPDWQRFYVSGVFPGVTGPLEFSISLAASTSVNLFGAQVDAQVTPSRYVLSTGQSGVCMEARFDGARIERLNTGPNRNSCVVFIRSNLPGGE